MRADADRSMGMTGLADESDLAGPGALSGEMTPDEVLEAAGLLGVEDESVFFYELFIATPDMPPKPREIPCEQWQAALKYRTLTPQEQAARERYFERKSDEVLRKRSAAK